MATANSYVQDGTGTYIPATQRPDGSWRKARRVKDGYIPQDEMPLYESKGKQWAKNKPTLPVGLDPSHVIQVGNSTTKSIPGLSVTNNESGVLTKSSKKKKKKKSDKADGIACDVGKLNISGSEKSSTTESSTPKSQPVSTDPVKRLRNLKKKVRDINALQQKIDSGELANPDKDQLEKIARKELIEAEIEELELEL